MPPGSQDSRYLPCPDPAGARQRVTAGTSTGPGLYPDGACVVDAWLSTHGGRPAALDLIRRLHDGDEFTDIVSP
ncbi:hypothetical protein [Actinoplanes sp. NPDC049265]|uniref:hypothetical protein n=1 Tax=Actinoplanes sp. NPDC049265 TaxID=3363902 RepID=UPI00371FB862